MLAGNGTIVLLFVLNGIFRGDGDPAASMRAIFLASLLNLGLAPLFMFGVGPIPALGVTGAAVATNLARGSAVVYQLWTITRPTGRIALTRRHVRLDKAELASVAALSAAAIFQTAVEMAS